MAQTSVASAEASARARSVHANPPASPAKVLGNPWSRLFVVSSMFAALAVAAGVRGGAVLLHFDEPVERFVIEHRTAWLDTVFRSASFLGSTSFIFIGGAVLAAIAKPRCWALATLVVVATLVRPLIEFVIKRLVSRERPSLNQMVGGDGPAFPSGHPMAGSMLWLLLPAVVALYYPSRRLWWTVTAGALVVVGAIGFSRIYLGVHWLTDVVGGILFAAVLLTALDAGFRWAHQRRQCALVLQGAGR